MAITKDEFESFRGDLIAHLAHKFQITREDALAKLGDWLIEPAGRKSRALAHAGRRGDTASCDGLGVEQTQVDGAKLSENLDVPGRGVGND